MTTGVAVHAIGAGVVEIVVFATSVVVVNTDVMVDVGAVVITSDIVVGVAVQTIGTGVVDIVVFANIVVEVAGFGVAVVAVIVGAAINAVDIIVIASNRFP